MDTRNGRIYRSVLDVPERDQKYLIPMKVPPTPLQRAAGKVQRNDPCPCGSGKKFKRCCLVTPVVADVEKAEE